MEKKKFQKESAYIDPDELRLTVDGKFNSSTVDYIKDKYVSSEEKLVGFGHGGSESLTIFLRNNDGGKFVRKILNQNYITAKWDDRGRGVMVPPVKKAIKQARYLSKLPGEVKSYFPKVIRADFDINDISNYDAPEYQYDMTFVGGIEVSKFVREYSPSPRVVAMLYTEIFRVLRKNIHCVDKREVDYSSLEASYFDKIDDRLELCKKTSPITFGESLLSAKFVNVNGALLRNYRGVIEVLKNNKEFLKILEPKYHGLVVGDTNTENIKIENIEPLLNVNENYSFSEQQFDASDIGLRFLDPRAIGFHIDGEDTGVDDYMYDNKPWHNSIGNYDKIHGEHFDMDFKCADGIPHVTISFHEQNPYSDSYDNIETYFGASMQSAYEYLDPGSDFVKQDPNWLVRFVFIMGTHFMAMPPFHFKQQKNGTYLDDPQSQKRPLAIYMEGLKWLNCALDILEGKRHTFLGVPTHNRTSN